MEQPTLPFRSPKKRVANIFRRNSMSDDRRGTSTQSIINNMERDSKKRSVVNDIQRNSFPIVGSNRYGSRILENL